MNFVLILCYINEDLAQKLKRTSILSCIVSQCYTIRHNKSMLHDKELKFSLKIQKIKINLENLGVYLSQKFAFFNNLNTINHIIWKMELSMILKLKVQEVWSAPLSFFLFSVTLSQDLGKYLSFWTYFVLLVRFFTSWKH